ncbi:MAG TPA: pyridoxal phosphate-dependent aminotransferase, partial [Thermoproteota archaeon]|nr:pyridoxal phosphate-dependent aminotransferase [Thermoproteota archaeon]
MKPSASKRAQSVKGETAFTVLAKAKELEAKGRRVIHLEIGEPDLDTPQHIRQAGIEAIQRGETHYTPTPGIAELRQAIADDTREQLSIDVNWKENVLVTVGGKEAIFASLATVLEQGDEVVVPDPSYPAYEAVVRFLGAKPVLLRLREEDEFRASPDEVNRLLTSKTKAIVLNSPSNPTGAVMKKEEVKAVAELAADHDALVLSDEIYKSIIYGGAKHYSPSQFAGGLETTMIADGFSKRFAMTGWRLGYLILPSRLSDGASKILNVMTSCASAFVQRAGIAALRGPKEPVNDMVRTYAERREALVEEVSKIPNISMVRP